MIVAGGEDDGVVGLHAGGNEVFARLQILPRFMEAFALSADSATLYAVGVDAVGKRELFRVDTRTVRLIERRQVSDIKGASTAGPLDIFGSLAMAVLPDGERLALAPAYRNGVAGIAILDAGSWQPVDFVHPIHLQPAGMEPLPPSPGFPMGAVLLIGARDENVQPSLDWLFFLDAQSLQIVDSAAIAPPASDSRGTLQQVLPAPGGQQAYVVGRSQIYRYDIARRETTDSVPRPSRGRLSISADGSILFITDPGDGFDDPGSGLLFLLDADLNPLAPIDLSAERSGFSPPVAGAVAAGSTDRFAYVLTGTASRGPLFGPQPGRLFVVDVPAREVLTAIDLGGFGFWSIFVVAAR